jgi:hypothetical protein
MGIARPQFVDEQPLIWMVAADILNKQPWTADKGWSSNLGLVELLTTPRRKNFLVTRRKHLPRAWTDPLYIFFFTSADGRVAGSCECDNELSGSIKCGEFLD